jgi:hypothetical protein
MAYFWDYLVFHGIVPEEDAPHPAALTPEQRAALRSDAIPCVSPSEVVLYDVPWVQNLRTLRHIGVVKDRFYFTSIANEFYLCDEGIKHKAFYLGANCVVGVERHAHLHEDPMWVEVSGTATVSGKL